MTSNKKNKRISNSSPLRIISHRLEATPDCFQPIFDYFFTLPRLANVKWKPQKIHPLSCHLLSYSYFIKKILLLDALCIMNLKRMKQLLFFILNTRRMQTRNVVFWLVTWTYVFYVLCTYFWYTDHEKKVKYVPESLNRKNVRCCNLI